MSSTSRGRPARASARFPLRPLLVALAAAGLIAPGARAATIPVTTGGDAGNAGTCTLRQAVQSLNTAALVGACTNSSPNPFGSNDTVDLTGQTGTLLLTGGELVLDVSMDFEGPGATLLTISGGNASRILNTGSSSLELDIRQLTIANGRSAGPGGCILALQGEVDLFEAVISGCQAVHDPGFLFPFGPGPVLNGLGGGIFAYAVGLSRSTVSGNTAQTGGGGVLASYFGAYRSAITGNAVTGHACAVDPDPEESDKYCVTAAIGGGGVVGTRTVTLIGSTVSGNTVAASTFTDGTDTYRVGWGGGVVHLSKYTDVDDLQASSKGTIAGAGALFGRPAPAAVARGRAHAAGFAKTLAQRAGKPRAKADGYGERRFGMVDSTLSGNRVTGGGAAVTLGAKYGGGGAAFFSTTENAEVANSTVSGNSLPAGIGCGFVGEPVPPVILSCGAGLSGDSFELTNSTVTGNAGWSAVQQFKYESEPPDMLAAKAKASKALARHPKLQSLHARWTQKAAGRVAKRSVAKASSPPIFDSTIVAGNLGTYDVACVDDCTISGANNLVRTWQDTVTFVNAPLSANPQLAPLANNGGGVAGAPGVAGTGPVRTHALYIGSPAIDAGSNIEGFSYDQRGPGFPRQTGAGVDIGAYEGAIALPVERPIPGLGPAGLALLSSMLAFAAAYLRRRRTI